MNIFERVFGKIKNISTIYFGKDLDGNVIQHYGTKRKSGRYEWGSGEDPYQHEWWYGHKREDKANNDIEGVRPAVSVELVDNLKKGARAQGHEPTPKELADYFGLSTTQYRAEYSIAKDAYRAEMSARAISLLDKGYSREKARELMGGIPEATFRTYIDPTYAVRANKTRACAETIKSNVDKKGYIDVSSGVELDVGVSRDRFKTAIAVLEKEGYKKYYIKVPQMGTNHSTTMEVLAPPGTTFGEVWTNRDQIKTIGETSGDNGYTFLGLKPIKSVDSSRVKIRYNEEGGLDKDGLIEIRRGVDDLSLGNSRYAQVRIGVDDTHYLKGMAVYSDGKDMPPGVDIIFNTNKHLGTPMIGEKDHEVLKRMKLDKDGNVDKDNPFGASIQPGDRGQPDYIDSDGNVQRGCVNIVNSEGDWGNWSKNLASQFLSKQYPRLAKQQLDLAYKDKREEFETIMSLNQPTIKKRLLESFADDCDSSAVHLKAAALPGQQSHVLIPFPDLPEDQIYAPRYENGTQLALIRYPHGGTFEIPVLTVNNNFKPAKEILGNAPDAVGVNKKTADQLSGADFDGDTALCIPTTNVKINHRSPLKGLEGFDPKEAYPGYEGMKVLTEQNKQNEMGRVSNLITDMTLGGATEDEISRAVRHSMVIIDAAKHKLNYKLSEERNGIQALKEKYQEGGASTLISRAKNEATVDRRKDWQITNNVVDKETGEIRNKSVDLKTGEKIYEYTGQTYKKGKLKGVSKNEGGYVFVNEDKDGRIYYLKRDPDTGKNQRVYANESDFTWIKEHKSTQKSTKMAEAKDAYELSSGTQMEGLYANYANSLKALANEARLAYVNTPNLKYDPDAKKKYSEEVQSLDRKLIIAKQNRPRERQAQLLANKIVSSRREANPDMDADDLKKCKSQALAGARIMVGAHKDPVEFTDREWEAVESGAISNSKLMSLLNNADLDKVKQRAMPRISNELSSSKQALIKSMALSGYTTGDIAARIGVSPSTVNKYLNGAA